MANRLPTVGGDSGSWGTLLNAFLSTEHNPADGTHTLSISQLVSGSPAQANDIIPIVRGTTPFRLSVGDVTTFALNIPATTDNATGIVNKAGAAWLHNFKPASNDGNNLFLGLGAGNFTMGGATSYFGSNNVAIGDKTLMSNTTGYDNVAIGYTALRLNTTGYWNTAVGMDALRSNTTGEENTAIGEDVLPSNTTGNNNCAVGGDTMYFNTTGSENVAIGIDALEYNVDGNYNTAVGKAALNANVSGIQNVAVGRWAAGASLGNNNVAVGFNALRDATTGYQNVAVGQGAGFSNTTGGQCVFIGNLAGYYETGSNKLFIDNQQRASEADGRAKSLIYGIFASAVANQYLVFNAGAMGFFGHAAASQPTKAGHNNWAAVSDVVAALVSIGILDVA